MFVLPSFACSFVCLFVFVRLFVFVCSFVCSFVFVRLFVFVCSFVCLFVFVRLFVFVCSFVCLCLFVCLFVCLFFLCLFVFVRFCLFVWFSFVSLFVCSAAGGASASGRRCTTTLTRCERAHAHASAHAHTRRDKCAPTHSNVHSLTLNTRSRTHAQPHAPKHPARRSRHIERTACAPAQSKPVDVFRFRFDSARVLGRSATRPNTRAPVTSQSTCSRLRSCAEIGARVECCCCV